MPTSAQPPTPIPTLAEVIPKPVSVNSGSGAFALTAATVIFVESGNTEVTRVAEYLSGKLQPATGYQLSVVPAAAGPTDGNFYLTTAGAEAAWGDEGYRLTITTSTITLVANQPAGLFYGVQTIRQLLPAAIEKSTLQAGAWQLPTGVITDYPRFTWRGAMLDVARHFFGVDAIKRYLDLMAYYKLNRFHLHLTDDQGWRLMINSWPKLASFGGSTAVGGDPGGYFTQADYAAIVAYAAARFITVVPEIDLPGHTNAALASYGELNCNGVAPPLYTGTEVGFSSLCLSSPTTYTFLEDVIGEVAALTPGPYIHIGGDEARATSLPDYLSFVEKIQRIVQAHGKAMVGWEEIALAPLLPSSIAQHWDSALAVQAAQAGSKVIMSPASRAYLDMKYNAATPLGQNWAGLIDSQTAYGWDPATQVDGLTEQDILGVEAPLWTETLRTAADLDFMSFPRLPGYAEISWSPAGSRNWDEYKYRLAAQGPRLEAAGVDFFRTSEVTWP